MTTYRPVRPQITTLGSDHTLSTIVRNRLRFESNFVQIPNAWMRDERISFGARGLLAHLMTHDSGWKTSIATLVKNGPQGRVAVAGMLKELLEAGYMKRTQLREGTGFGAVQYTLMDPFEPEIPGEDQQAQNLLAGNVQAGHVPAAKDAPKNTNTKNTNLSEDQDEENGGETLVGTSPDAHEDDEKTTPWEDLNGRALERPAAPRRADRCDFHQGDGYPPPCFGCKTARKAMIDADREKFHAALAQEKEIQLAAHQQRIENIGTCGLCDEDGYINGWLCEHDPGRAERVISGAAMLRQALRGGQDG